jgi:hypothetical protein
MSEDARGSSIETAKAVVCVSGCRSIALVATLLVWWCALGVPTNTARADDCLTAPNSPAPAGSHWYFRPDRAKQRNCWYLHASDQPRQPAAAQAKPSATPATDTIAFKKRATAPPSAPTSTSPGDSAAPSLPPLKPQAAPMSSATTDQPQSAQKRSSATSIPDAFAPQASPSSQTSTQGAEPAPAATTVSPDPPAVAAVKQEPPVSSESVQASDNAESTGRDGGSTANAARTAPPVTARPSKLEIRM